jgi:outer membrane protein assembly factor BamD
LALCALSAFGCASLSKSQSQKGADKGGEEEADSSEDLDTFGKPAGKNARGQTESTVTVRYEKTVEENWKRAEQEYADENYAVAQKFYAYIKSKFPYSAFAVKAELKLGDCFFARQRYLEAIDAYQNFIRLHPTHKDVGYATYRTGAAHFEQIPSDWFLVPPSFEKDQAPVREAERALRAYVDRFPSDANWKDGDKLLKDVRRRMVQHERYVADFYRRLEKMRAYVGRLEVIRSQYADVALDDALLAEIVAAYAGLADAPKASAVLKDFETRFPSSPLLDKARSSVSAIPAGPAETASKS